IDGDGGGRVQGGLFGIGERAEEEIDPQRRPRLDALQEAHAARGGIRARALGPKARREAFEEEPRGIGIVGERVDDRGTWRQAGLRSVASIGPETVDRMPVQTRLEDEPVQPVVGHLPCLEGEDRLGQATRYRPDVEAAVLAVLDAEGLADERWRALRRA